MSRVNEIARTVLRENGNDPEDEDVVNKFLAECGHEELFQLAHSYIGNVSRALTREAEEEAFQRRREVAEEQRTEKLSKVPPPSKRQSIRSKQIMAEVQEAAKSYDKLLDQPVRIRRGMPPVKWGDLTIEQHRERRDYLLEMIERDREAVRRHEQAISDLETTGCRTLREMGALGAA